MNHYTFQDLSIGHTESFSRTVTAEMMDRFLRISGDENPLHCSEEFAARRGYPGRVVYGMLTASLYSTLAGVYLPGEYCLLYEVSSKFHQPVYIGDTLHVTGEVKEKNDVFQVVSIKATITNENGEVVSTAKLKAGFTQQK